MSTPGFTVDLGDANPLEISGWDALELGVNNDDDRTRQEQVDHASMYRQLFATPTGRYVLNDLIEVFFKQRIVVPGSEPDANGIRQGQHDVVERIFHMIEFANTGGGKPTGTGVPTEE